MEKIKIENCRRQKETADSEAKKTALAQLFKLVNPTPKTGAFRSLRRVTEKGIPEFNSKDLQTSTKAPRVTHTGTCLVERMILGRLDSAIRRRKRACDDVTASQILVVLLCCV